MLAKVITFLITKKTKVITFLSFSGDDIPAPSSPSLVSKHCSSTGKNVVKAKGFKKVPGRWSNMQEETVIFY